MYSSLTRMAKDYNLTTIYKFTYSLHIQCSLREPKSLHLRWSWEFGDPGACIHIDPIDTVSFANRDGVAFEPFFFVQSHVPWRLGCTSEHDFSAEFHSFPQCDDFLARFNAV